MEAHDFRRRDADGATASSAIALTPLLGGGTAGRPQPTTRRAGVLASAPGKATIGIGATECRSEYVWRGEYHRELDKNWPYFPVYVEKLRRVCQFLQTKRDLRILDVGCGEGVLVDEYRRMGYDITGLDLNFWRPGIVRGSVLEIPFVDDSIDVILCLDVLEHLNILDQPAAIAEIRRVPEARRRLSGHHPEPGAFCLTPEFLVAGQADPYLGGRAPPGRSPIQ